MQIIQDRRRFMTGLSAAAAVGLVSSPTSLHAEPPPESTTIRLAMPTAACLAPLSMAEEFLREEGFADVQYVPTTMTGAAMLADGDYDIDMHSWSDYLPLVDAARPITVLSGIHAGCLELRANDSIRGIADLRRKRVGITTSMSPTTCWSA